MSKIRAFVAVLFGKLWRFHSVSCGNKKGCLYRAREVDTENNFRC